MTEAEKDELIREIRESRPHLLFAAFGQPKGELWVAEHGEALGVPVTVQIGASLDFVAGRVRRSPRWMQRVGLEWVYRLWREPRRLVGRYFSNGLFALANAGQARRGHTARAAALIYKKKRKRPDLSVRPPPFTSYRLSEYFLSSGCRNRRHRRHRCGRRGLHAAWPR